MTLIVGSLLGLAIGVPLLTIGYQHRDLDMDYPIAGYLLTAMGVLGLFFSGFFFLMRAVIKPRPK